MNPSPRNPLKNYVERGFDGYGHVDWHEVIKLAGLLGCAWKAIKYEGIGGIVKGSWIENCWSNCGVGKKIAAVSKVILGGLQRYGGQGHWLTRREQPTS